MLAFSDLPFTFGRDISVSLPLRTVSGTRTFGTSYALAEADYAHTMTWSGLSDVHDTAGNLITGYTAVSADFGFDLANPTPVPEPATALLRLAGPSLVSLRKWRLAASP